MVKKSPKIVTLASVTFDHSPPSPYSKIMQNIILFSFNDRLEAAMQRLTNLCSVLNDMEPICVLNHVFVLREV